MIRLSALAAAAALALAALPAAAQSRCPEYGGPHLFVSTATLLGGAAANHIEAYVNEPTRARHVKACNVTRTALKHWVDGANRCREYPRCREAGFRAACKEIGRKVPEWNGYQAKVCEGL